jgi:DNA-binding MarR family transcriptional regulator
MSRQQFDFAEHQPMAMTSLYGKPGHLIRRAQQIAVAIFMDECAAFDVTPVQYAALVAIRETPGIAATQLSSVVAFDRSTLGKVLERLEAKKLIVRKPTTEDKRTKLLHLTPAGRTLLDAVEPLVQRSQKRILQPLNAKERALFVELLHRMVELNNDSSRAPLRAAFDETTA